MSVRISRALAASLFFVACENSGASAAATNGVGPSASTNWNDDRLDSAKVDYFFSTMEKLTDYALAHPEADLDAIAMDGSETEADYAKRMNADPKLKQIFTSTGIDPLRYANVSGIMAGTMFGVGLAGKNIDSSKLPQAAQYYLAHRAEIDGRMAAFKQREEALAKAKGRDSE